MPRPRVRFIYELIGTAVLLLAGLSLVILMFGDGSPIAPLVPNVRVRQAITGFLFGTVGGAIALSRVGRESGAHINPAVTFGFWLMGKIESRIAVGYMAAQLTGAVLGCLPLLAWGSMGRSIAFGATTPGPGYTISAALVGEVLTTFGLIATLCIFIGLRPLRRFTPATMPLLYSFMVPLEAAISGTSTNPARSFGPAVISGEWNGWWIYWLGPMLGTLAGIALFSFLGMKVEEAKLYYFENDQRKIFRATARRAGA
ncbi:MAG TPA: aquaporin [Bryobacteraceae bacterium]|jgi:aquaporin Z